MFIEVYSISSLQLSLSRSFSLSLCTFCIPYYSLHLLESYGYTSMDMKPFYDIALHRHSCLSCWCLPFAWCIIPDLDGGNGWGRGKVSRLFDMHSNLWLDPHFEPKTYMNIQSDDIEAIETNQLLNSKKYRYPKTREIKMSGETVCTIHDCMKNNDQILYCRGLGSEILWQNFAIIRLPLTPRPLSFPPDVATSHVNHISYDYQK